MLRRRSREILVGLASALAVALLGLVTGLTLGDYGLLISCPVGLVLGAIYGAYLVQRGVL